MINAMNMFNVQRMGTNPSMYEIGYRGAPAGGVAEAMRGTIATYRANLAAQQEQQDKIGLLGAENTYKLGQIKYENQLKKPWMFDSAGNPRQISTADLQPRIVSRREPLTGKVLIATKRFDPEKGYDEYSTFSPVTPLSAMDEYKNRMIQKMLNGNPEPVDPDQALIDRLNNAAAMYRSRQQ